MNNINYTSKKQSRLNLIILIVLGLFLVVINKAFGFPNSYWKCVIGEAAQCGYSEMKAVALVYRNRLEKKMKLGCVALYRQDLEDFIIRQNNATRETAKQVVQEVFIDKCKDITNGATHYENVKAFGEPYWAKDMKITMRLNCHTFYKER